MPLAPHPLEYGRSYVLSRELFGNTLGAESIPNFIRGLDLRNSLTSLAKAVWLLEDKGALSREAQYYLATQYLIATRLPLARNLLRDPSRILYFEPQLLALMKYVCLHSQLNDPPKFVTTREVVTLGTALHAATDLIARESIRIRRSLEFEDRLSNVVLQLSLGEHMIKSRRPLFEVIRSKLMYVKSHQILKEDPPNNFIDIDDVFFEATGVSINEYLEVGLGFIFNLLRYRGSQTMLPLDKDFILFHPLNWFSKSKLDKDSTEKIFRIVSQPINEFRASIENQNNRELGYDFLSMKSRPLLKLGRDTFLPFSYDFVIEKFTTGVYWMIFDHLLQHYDDDKQLRFSEYNGLLFERYVAEIASVIFSRDIKGERFLTDEVYYKGKSTFRTSDAILSGEDYLILIEATASRITAKRTLAQGIAEAFIDDCDKVVWKKARELDRFIKDIYEGSVEVNGLEIPIKEKIFPVIVTIEGFPKIPSIDEYIIRGIEEMEILQQSSTLPLSILSIDDLEDAAKDDGLLLHKAILNWQSHNNFPFISLSQFLSLEQDILSGKESDWFSDNLKTTMNEACITIFNRSYDEIIAEEGYHQMNEMNII
jgi:hypothetical protein